jgi:hypothetical protein
MSYGIQAKANGKRRAVQTLKLKGLVKKRKK